MAANFDVQEAMSTWSDEQMAVATDVVISWFGKEGRNAYDLVLEQQPDPAALTETVAWLEDMAEEARNG